MVSRVRVLVLIKGIIALNWLLGKLTLILAQESIIKLAAAKFDNKIVILDDACYLDKCFDNDNNVRKSLNMWKHRI